MKQRRSVSLIHTLLIMLLVGCGATVRGYQGSADSKETARLRAHGVRIHLVNGIKIGADATEIEILPGRNELVVSITPANFNMLNRYDDLFTFKIEAQAGKVYAVTGKRGDGRLCAFPIAPETGKPDFQHPAGCYTLEYHQAAQRRPLLQSN